MIELKHLGKIYSSASGSVEALKDVNLTIADGEIFGIIGLSGAGKSTLVRCINLLERPTSGEVLVDGQNIMALSQKELLQVRRQIGMIFQGFNLLEQRTVLRNICFPLEIAGVKRDKAQARAEELLELVGLSDRAKAYPSQLSGGQKQRVAIARALATRPKYLLCDEATSALDPNTTQAILRLLKQINQTLGVTDLTAWQNLKVQCLQRGLNEADIAPTLQLVGLKDTGSKPAGKFSLGMRQRLGLAVALLGKPKFLVLDEPLNGLDPMGIQELRYLLEKLNREQGMTILLSSHILSELHQLATSYGILHNGQLLEQLTAEELDARCSKYLLVRTDNDRRAVDILRKMFPEAICQATVEGLRLFPVGNEAAATASGVLMENGLHVQELAVRSEGLEAYFTALVGGDSHADAG